MSALIIQSVNEVMHIGAKTETYRKTGHSPSDPRFSVWFSHRTFVLVLLTQDLSEVSVTLSFRVSSTKKQ